MQALNEIKNFKEIKKLYKHAFPRSERVPFFLIKRFSKRRDVSLTAFYDGGTFCGFSYSVESDTLFLVLYLAVSKEVRGQGYGGKILSYLKETHPDKTVVLHIEPLDESAPNIEERKSRLNFYLKNGFINTGYFVEEVGGRFLILSQKPEVDYREYSQIFHRLSGGTVSGKIYSPDGKLMEFDRK